MTIPAGITRLATQRDEARAAKNWREADRLREQLRGEGWQVEDGAQGPVLRSLD